MMLYDACYTLRTFDKHVWVTRGRGASFALCSMAKCGDGWSMQWQTLVFTVDNGSSREVEKEGVVPKGFICSTNTGLR